MRFVNREVSTPNKKILTVEDVSYNQTTGEISQLIVIEANNEGDVTVEGTKLNVSILQAIGDTITTILSMLSR